MTIIVDKALRLKSGDRDLAREVKESLVETLYASPGSLAIGAIAGTAVSTTVAYVSGDPWLGWIAVAIGLVCAARVASAASYADRKKEGRLLGRRWEIFYELGAWSYALLLGVTTYFTLTRTSDINLHLLTMAVTTGYAAGISGRNAGRPAIAIGQMMLAAIPATFALMQSDELARWVLAVVNVLFTLSLTDITLQTYDALLKAFSAKHEQARLAERFERLARTDALTGLENRFAFQERLETLLGCSTATGASVAVFWIDLDRFKDINDSLGHQVGDNVLRAVSERLRSIADGRGHVARFGGDEFVFLTPIEDATAATYLAQDVLTVLSKPLQGEGLPMDIKASMGVAISPQHGTDMDGLLKHADMALYHAKAAGRATFCLFESTMQERFHKTLQIEAGLRRAIENDEFELLFQPIMDVRTGRTSSCEALLRWRHPVMGAIGPAEFVPIAEAIGLMPAITDWVLHQACAIAATWPSDTRIAINISPVSLKDSEFPFVVLSALYKSGLDPQRVELEITETVLLEENEQSKEILREFQAIGVRLALDDFGTGYSSLAYLRAYAFDTIKIDTSFVADLHTSREAKAIIRAVVGLADELGMETVAEGVERDEQLGLISAAGCTHVQGFLLGEPMPARAVLRRLKAEESEAQHAAAQKVTRLTGS